MVIISSIMFVIVFDMLVINVVVKSMILLEFILWSICFGDICKFRKGINF